MRAATSRRPLRSPSTRSRLASVGALLLSLVLASSPLMPGVARAEGGSAGGAIDASPGGGSGSSQGGSTGGMIAPPPEEKPKPEPERQERSERPPVTRRAEPEPRRTEPEPRRAEKRETGGNFDGSWSVHTSSSCGWSSNSAIRVSGSRVSGSGLSGSVSPNGGLRMVSHYQGLTHTSSGRLSGSSGSGSFRRSDGCSGSWTASR